MTRLLSFWESADPRRRAVAVLAAIAVLAAAIGLMRVVSQPSMALLYSGLDPAAAGGVVAALERQGVAHEARGDAIYVAETARDRARMALAAEGLPETGPAGYEILDGLSGFGTTAQMFDAAYWRAKEGELARTILASPQVRRARVHIANPARRPFERGVEPSASVVATMGSGTLGREQARAMRYLVASAVAGLKGEAVAVIDGEAGVILAAGEGEGAGAGGEDPAAMAARLRARVERLLAARVGPDSAVVEISVDTDRDSETITERVIDPDSRVAIHSDTEESTEQASGGGADAVTVASNLPDGDVEGGEGGTATRRSAQSRERKNYEVSEVLRERVRRPGDIRRITAAVMVDGVSETQPDGSAVWAPRPEAELETLRELVQSAIGFDAARGDVVTISSLEFSAPTTQGTVAEAGIGDLLAANLMTLIQLAVLALVALALGLFVLRPMLRAAPAGAGAEERTGALSGPESGEAEDGLVGEIDIDDSLAAAGQVIDAEGVGADRLAALREAIAARPEASGRILAGWLESGAAERGAA